MNRRGDDATAKMADARTKLYNLRGATTTVHPFLVTELVIKSALSGRIIRRVKLTRGES